MHVFEKRNFTKFSSLATLSATAKQSSSVDGPVDFRFPIDIICFITFKSVFMGLLCTILSVVQMLRDLRILNELKVLQKIMFSFIEVCYSNG